MLNRETILCLVSGTLSSAVFPTSLATCTCSWYSPSFQPVKVFLYLPSFSRCHIQSHDFSAICTWRISKFLILALLTVPMYRFIHPLAYLKSTFICVVYISSLQCPTINLDYCSYFKHKQKTSFSPLVTHVSKYYHHLPSHSCPNSWNQFYFSFCHASISSP